MRNALITSMALLAIATGCGSTTTGLDTGASGAANVGNAGSAGHGAAGETGSAGVGSGVTTGDGLPCEIAAMMRQYCVTCHASPPQGGAPQPLIAYANFTALAKSAPTEKVGVLSLARMQAGSMPPKPFPAPSAAEIATFNAWVDGGMPMTTCGLDVDAGLPINPYDTPRVCTSGVNWAGGNEGSDLMHPGGACIDCHSKGGEGPRYAIAGTVFPSAHEPLDCNGTSTSSAGALSVLITESNGKTHTLSVNSVGNFFYRGTIATPYTAQVMAGSAVRAMAHTQTSGDCNGCHTVDGASTAAGADPAPGRIMAP